MTTYYVSSSASSSGSGTSSSNPLTLQKAASLAAPGDVFLLESGTYNAASGGFALSVTKSGTASAPITFEAAPGATPIINVGTSAAGGVSVKGSYVTIKGIDVNGDAAGMSLSQAKSLGYSNATDANGIEIGSTGSYPIPTHDSIIGDTVTNMPGAGILADYADYITISGNTVDGNSFYSPYGTSGIDIYALQNSDNATGVKNIISGNTVFNNVEKVSEGGAGILDGEGIIIDDNSNSQTNGIQYTGTTVVENNLAYENGSYGIEVGRSSNVEVLYNTTYENGQSGVNQYEISAMFAPNTTVENNIMYAKPGGGTEKGYSTTGTWDYNDLYGGSSTGVTNGSHTITGNPLFVGPTSNFRTASNSPAVGAANSAYAVATDITGTARPSTHAEDGAYQSATSGTAAAAATPAVAATPVATADTASDPGADTLTLSTAADAAGGAASFTVSVDGTQVGGTYSTDAPASGTPDVLTLTGDWASGAHQVEITFLAAAGAPATDQLYLDGISYDGQASDAGAVTLSPGGSADFLVGSGTPSLLPDQPAASSGGVGLTAASSVPSVGVTPSTVDGPGMMGIPATS